MPGFIINLRGQPAPLFITGCKSTEQDSTKFYKEWREYQTQNS